MAVGSGPDLSVVKDDGSGDSLPPGAGSPEGDEGAPKSPSAFRGRILVVVLAFSLVGLGLLALQQYQRAEFLRAEVGALQSELLAVRGQLAAHRSHLDRVRLGFSDLSSAVAELRALVNTDPSAAPPASAAKNPPLPAPIGAPESTRPD